MSAPAPRPAAEVAGAWLQGLLLGTGLLLALLKLVALADGAQIFRYQGF